MKPLWNLAIAVAFAAALSGCQPAPSSPAAPPATSAGTTATSSTSSTTQPPPQTVGQPSETALKPADVPAELKSDAYHYYGVENTAPITLEISKPDGSTVVGTSTNRIKEVKDGKVIVSVNREGGLTILGSEEDAVEKDGIHTLSTTMGEMKTPDALELPAKLDPGTTWKVTHEIVRADGIAVSENMTYTVVGKKKVDTKAGPYNDALLVTMEGKTTVKGKTAHAAGKVWYVFDKGMVRMELTQGPTDPGKGTQTIMIQETK